MAIDRSRLTTTTRLALGERDLVDLREDVNDHERRLRPLERLAAKVLGAAAAGGLASGVISALIAKGL